MSKSFPVYKLIILFVISITFLFLLPLFIDGFSGISIVQLFLNSSNGFTMSLLRTFTFAFLSSIVNTLVGFYLALLFSKIPLISSLGKQLSFFILPITLGNVAIVFVFKVLLFNSSFFDTIVQGGYITQTLLLLFIQFWQFGFLFAYLFWINFKNTPKCIDDYSIATGLTRFEKIRDIILPQSRNLFILLLFIGFIFAFYEDTKSQFIFRASQGTETELLNHWIYRTYQSDLLINPVYANQSIFKTGIIVLTITVITFLFIGLLALVSFHLFSKIKSNNDVALEDQEIKYQRRVSLIIAPFCITIIVFPVVVALFKSQYHFSNVIYSTAFPIAITLVAAFTATIFAIIFGIASRLLFRKWLSSFNSKSLFYFLAIFLLQIIPPLIIVLCGFKWLSWIGYNSDLLIYVIWIIGHCFLTLPLLGSFVVATHFTVRENELNYITAYQISSGNIVQYSFIKRFKAEYIFTFLFAFSFIWNDSGLNMVLSDSIPSFAANLQMLFIGRAADYSKATVFVLVAVFLSFSCIYTWQYIMGKSNSINRNEVH